MTRQPNMVNIPAVPMKLDRDMHDFLSAVKAGIRLRNGGFPQMQGERFILLNEYQDSLKQIETLEAQMLALTVRVEALENP